jgi:Spy/CpxP family protein refolding chaperone
MKKNFLFTTILLCFSVFVLAQRPNAAKIDQAKIAILSTKLNLTEQQAIKFWPVYNQYMAEIKTAYQKRKQANDALANIDAASDADVERAMNQLMQSQEEELAIRKKYRTEFSKTLSVKQVAKLMQAEKEFKELLIKRLSKGNGAVPQGRGRFRN